MGLLTARNWRRMHGITAGWQRISDGGQIAQNGDFVNLVCDAVPRNGPSSNVTREKTVYVFCRQSAGGTPRLWMGASNEQRDSLRRQSMYHLSDRNQIPVTSAKETQRAAKRLWGFCRMPLDATRAQIYGLALFVLLNKKRLKNKLLSDSRKPDIKFTWQ